MADKYDDLDDLLDEFEEQDRILGSSETPGANALAGKADAASAADSKLSTADNTPTSVEAGSGGAAAGNAARGATAKNNTQTGLQSAGTSVAGSDKGGADASRPQRPAPAAPISATSGPERDEDVANQLNKGMDELVRQLEGDDPAAAQQLQALMASLMGEELSAGRGAAGAGAAGANAGTHSGAAAAKSTTGAENGASPAAFQDVIAQTMNRLNEAQPGANEDPDADFLESMLRDLGGAAGASGGDMEGLLAGLMEELSSKEILYEPIKEMHDKYPEWIEKNKDKISAAELQRYRDQQRAIADMVAKFDEPSYSDNDASSRKYIAAKMEAMQATGAPPPELMSSLANGAIPGGLSGNPGDCCIM